ncbi:MAG: DUF748 domain-containing protein, partial [bacterium]
MSRRTEEPRGRDRLRRTILALAITTIVVVSIAIGAPIALREIFEWQASERLGIPVSIDGVDLDVLAGGITLHGIAIGPPTPSEGATATSASDPADPPASSETCWICVKRFSVDLAWGSLREEALRLQRIELDRPRLRLLRFAEGGINAARLLEPDSEAEPPDAERAESRAPPQPRAREQEEAGQEASGEKAFALRIDRLSVRQGQVHFRDRTLAAPASIQLDIEDISLRRLSTGVSNAYEAPSQIGIEAAVAGAPLRLEAQWEARGPDLLLEGTLEAEGLPLDRVRAYASGAGIRGLAGTVDLEIEIRAQGEPRDQARLALTLHDGSADWESRPEPPAAKEAPPELRIGVERASLETRVKAPALSALAETPEEKVDVSGELSVRSFEAVDPVEDRFSVSLAALEIGVGDVVIPRRPQGDPESTSSPAPDAASSPGIVRLERVEIREPRARLRITPEGLFLPGLDRSGERRDRSGTREPAPEQEPGASASSNPSPRIEIAGVRLTDGLVSLEDRTVEPFVRLRWGAIGLDAEGLAWPEGRLERFELEARSGKDLDGGSLRVRGDADLPRAKIRVDLDRLRLPPFNPYVTRLSGYAIASGESSLESEIESGTERLRADNRLRLHDFSLETSDPSPGFRSRFGVPLSLGLALLRDPGGGIELHFDLEAPHGEALALQLGSLLQNALTRAFVNTLATPLKILGSLRREGDREIERFEPGSIDFAAGQAAPTAEGERELEAVADLMVIRPQLGITLHGRAAPQDLSSREPADEPGEENGESREGSGDEPDALDPSTRDRLEALGRDRTDAVCRVFRDLRGIPVDRIRVATRIEVGKDVEPGVRLSLHVSGENPEETEPCPEPEAEA